MDDEPAGVKGVSEACRMSGRMEAASAPEIRFTSNGWLLPACKVAYTDVKLEFILLCLHLYFFFFFFILLCLRLCFFVFLLFILPCLHFCFCCLFWCTCISVSLLFILLCVHLCFFVSFSTAVRASLFVYYLFYCACISVFLLSILRCVHLFLCY